MLIKSKDNIGYFKGSFVLGLLKKMNFDESRILPYKSPEEMDELFSKGSKNGGIIAAFDEIPYIKVFLAKYCSKYTMVGPTYKTDGFGFVFPIGSPLVPDISRATLNVTESDKMMDIEETWFGDEIKCPDSSALFSSNSLGLESFWGLFLIVGIAAVSAFIIYVAKFLRENWHVIEQTNPKSTIWSKTLELLQRFNNRDLSSHTFKNIARRESDNGSVDDCRKTVQLSPSTFSLTSPHTNAPPSPIFSSPEEQRISLQGEQVISLEDESRKSQGETSHVIKQEIELVNPNVKSN